MAAPPSHPSAGLPLEPNDPNVQLPIAPLSPPPSPPLVEDGIQAVQNGEDVNLNSGHVDPQTAVPPWAHAAFQQFHKGVVGDLRAGLVAPLQQSTNGRRHEGYVVKFEIVFFENGDNPTQAPHHLPPLHNVDDINNIQPPHLVRYLHGYGVDPLPSAGSPYATNHLRKNILKQKVGCTR